MNINNTFIHSNSDWKNQLANEKIIQIQNDVIEDDIKEIFQEIFKVEETNENLNIKIQCKDFQSERLITVFKFLLNECNLEKIRNISVIQNLLPIIRSYNTFDSAFFNDQDIFVNSIEDFIDIKTDLKEEIGNFILKITELFISLCRSSCKFEYTELSLDNYEDIPLFYSTFLSGIDMYTIFDMMSQLPSNIKLELRYYKLASDYIGNLVENFKCSNALIMRLLEKNKNDN